MTPPPHWARDGADWPFREASRFIRVGELLWHVQSYGAGPPALLIHGAGAATHSWRDLGALLAERFTVLAMDLPGHGFTGLAGRAERTLPGMAQALRTLLQALCIAPRLVIGHSAGAAIGLRLALDAPQAFAPPAPLIVTLNAAIAPFPGLAGQLFPGIAKALFYNPLAIHAFALSARDDRAIERLIASTGSQLEARGRDLYARLLRMPRHIEGTLGMMAHWDLPPLQADLPRLGAEVLLLTGAEDLAVPPSVSREAARLMPKATVEELKGLGHLAHEEAPDRVAARIFAAFDAAARAPAA